MNDGELKKERLEKKGEAPFKMPKAGIWPIGMEGCSGASSKDKKD